LPKGFTDEDSGICDDIFGEIMKEVDHEIDEYCTALEYRSLTFWLGLFLIGFGVAMLLGSKLYGIGLLIILFVIYLFFSGSSIFYMAIATLVLSALAAFKSEE
jgi:hypothetical protein